MIQPAGLALVLVALWLGFSGHFDPLFLTLGTVSVLLTIWICARMQVMDAEGHSVQLPMSVFIYFPWLMWEIIKSNIQVAGIILSPSLRISPRVFYVKASQETVLGKVIYANSITLTPGTVTIDVNGDEFEVHALTRESQDGLMTGRMDRRVTEMATSK